MKTRYRLTRRGSRGDTYYCKDTRTGKRTSLETADRQQAERLLQAKNEADLQPSLNLQIARAYLLGGDSERAKRTWRDAFDSLIESKDGANKERWQRAAKDKAFGPLFPRPIVETQAEEFLRVLATGCVSTNNFLRRLQNFALDMNWLPWPLVPKRQWPKVKHKEKRAITLDEHTRIVAREGNAERKAYYQLAWYFGPAQTDLANLDAKDIDWENRVVSFFRRKTEQPVQIRFGDEAAKILKGLPEIGPLFPYLRTVDSRARANEFRERCRALGIHGISLHCYRYSWAERAKQAGYPERYAQLALGHGSKAVHRAYAKKAQVTLPPLEDYEKQATPAKVITLPLPAAG